MDIPQTAQELFRLAGDLHRAGRFDDAESVLKKALELEPRLPGIYLKLAGVLQAQGRLEESASAYRQAISIRADIPEAHNNLAFVLNALGEFDQARGACETALRLKSDFPQAQNNLGNALHELGKSKEAEAAYRAALEYMPDAAEIHNNLGNTLQEQQRFREAAAAYDEARRLDPDIPEVYRNAGNILYIEGRVDEAEQAYREALRLNPRFAGAYNGLGVSLQIKGRVKDAEQMFRQALEIDPRLAQAWRRITIGKHYESPEDPDVREIRQLLEDADTGPRDQIELHFALGKIYDDCGDYARAFEYYKTANQLTGNSARFDRSVLDNFLERTRKTFPAGYFTKDKQTAADSDLPVFVVGMPRSGTTLVEQLLSSHPQVFGAGELAKLQHLIDQLPTVISSHAEYPEICREIDEDTGRYLAEEYRNHIRKLAGPRYSRVVDKKPSNFHDLGFLKLVFPQARIIHCRRDPLDTCLSIYFQYFTYGNFYAYDLEDIGYYYRRYRELMSHWRNAGIDMYEIDYEDLVENTGERACELVGYLGLEWDDGVLQFHQTERTVRTASAWQVRQPIYRRSVERWKHYEPFLGELRTIVGKTSG